MRRNKDFFQMKKVLMMIDDFGRLASVLCLVSVPSKNYPFTRRTTKTPLSLRDSVLAIFCDGRRIVCLCGKMLQTHKPRNTKQKHRLPSIIRQPPLPLAPN
jgi:hypothetical protein